MIESVGNVMYVLWLVAACQIILPVSVSGIYNALPQAVSQKVAMTTKSVQIEELASRMQGGKEVSNMPVSANEKADILGTKGGFVEQTTDMADTKNRDENAVTKGICKIKIRRWSLRKRNF